MTLDDTDRLILNTLQEGFPITPNPFEDVALQLGITEAQLLSRLKAMKEARVITRFGPFFDAAAMGGAFCLCAMSVPERAFDDIVATVNAYPEVAHNYQRTHDLNMWFVLATETEAEIAEVAHEIESETGIKVLLFPKLQEFFIGFRVAA
ncbi:Lrp/AsnC family transcriptional regulator [Roseovarius aestuarii]|uniref:Siroheme decarboxylase NirG subunit n=1 Tax=Roseovarius aestuarii TaxID=475083 RepID=A0A1X7BTT6_9RHOB|nr:AsnC family transcriptional regulator [Roseovarius aestuarii]SMC13081.1 hypothetical protein ROA7745_02915 [Roseovarius aestuarii]